MNDILFDVDFFCHTRTMIVLHLVIELHVSLWHHPHYLCASPKVQLIIHGNPLSKSYIAGKKRYFSFIPCNDYIKYKSSNLMGYT